MLPRTSPHTCTLPLSTALTSTAIGESLERPAELLLPGLHNTTCLRSTDPAELPRIIDSNKLQAYRYSPPTSSPFYVMPCGCPLDIATVASNLEPDSDSNTVDGLAGFSKIVDIAPFYSKNLFASNSC